MFITIINDCNDQNSLGRQATHCASLFGCPVQTIGVQSDLEASGNLVDALDACGGREGIILVNVAPRSGKAKRWKNGTPFGYFYHKDTLVLSSIDGYSLSLVKKLGHANSIKVLDIPTVIDYVTQRGIIDNSLGKDIINTQFRSLQFLPRAAKWLHDKIDLPHRSISIDNVRDIPDTIWWIDNFGNCKTTITTAEPEKQALVLKDLDLPHFNCLKDIPTNSIGIISGSSGIGDIRFIEIAKQGGSAAEELTLTIGQELRG